MVPPPRSATTMLAPSWNVNLEMLYISENTQNHLHSGAGGSLVDTPVEASFTFGHEFNSLVALRCVRHKTATNCGFAHFILLRGLPAIWVAS